MLFAKTTKHRGSLAFRLTFWYAAVFAVSSAVAFLIFYLFITSVIRERIDQDLSTQAGDFSTLLRVRGLEAVKRVAILEAQAAGEKKYFIRLLRLNGEVFSSSNMSYWQNIGIHRDAIAQLTKGETQVIKTVILPNRLDNIRILYRQIGRGIFLQLGHSMEPYARFYQAFKTIFIITMGLLVILSALIGWFMARRALSGVKAVTRTARRIADGALEQRVPVKKAGDEIDQMAAMFNHMLDRIQTLVSGIRNMGDNIAHDLRSPITRIRGLAEVTLTTQTGNKAFEQMAASTIEECDGLLDMINAMLLISQSEAGASRIEANPVDLTSLLADACDLFQPAAEDGRISLTCQFPHVPVYLKGDVRLLQRMIANLLDNAIKYTPPDGTVHMDMRHQKTTGAIQIRVHDSGIGIASDEQPYIFDRFYRGDASRSKPGNGLGLSLARAVAKAHGGDITVFSHLDKGSEFMVSLPDSILCDPPLDPQNAAVFSKETTD